VRRATLLSQRPDVALWRPKWAQEALQEIFQRHCGAQLSAEVLESVQEAPHWSPGLVAEAMKLCKGESSLPFTSVDLWLDHADVAITSEEQDVMPLEMAIDEKCNHPDLDRRCVIFLSTGLLRSRTHGASLLVRALHQPFILLTANNEDECQPYRTFPRIAEAADDVETLIGSALLVRWYGKNMCLHPGHFGEKLRPLPLGPKWQFKSTAYHGEDKGEIKQRLVDAGAADPQAAFRRPDRQRTLYVAMLVKSAAKSWYHPARSIRLRAQKHLDLAFSGLGREAGSSFALAKTAPKLSHREYLLLLARQAFTLSPPGEMPSAAESSAPIYGLVPCLGCWLILSVGGFS
jgi:hypothetical protein